MGQSADQKGPSTDLENVKLPHKNSLEILEDLNRKKNTFFKHRTKTNGVCQQLTNNYLKTRTCQIDCFPTISATTTNLEIGPRAD